LGVAFSDGTHGWVVGDIGILATTNGGATWSKQNLESNGSAFAVAFPDAVHGWAVGDGDALVPLFVNVLDNAIKYTGGGGGVDVAARAADGYISVTVRDSGRGVPAEQLPHLFERFHRGDASRSAEGSALGLAIARLIAEAHGGTIAISSDERRETTCEVRLPAAAAGVTLPPLPTSRAR